MAKAKPAADPAPEPAEGGSAEYPMTLYRACKIDAKRPNGYEARQFLSPEAVAAAGKEWKESPADL